MNIKALSWTLVLILFLAISAYADVVAHHKTTFEMGKIMSMEMTGTDYVKSDRSCNEVTSNMTGGMAAMFGKGKPQEIVSITRLDKQLIWELEPSKKRYSEKTFDSMKKDMEELQGEAKETEGDDTEDEYIWTTEVKELGDQNINGFDCKGVMGLSTGVKKNDPADSLFVTYEQWMAQNVPGADEMTAFQKNYSQAIGVDEKWTGKGMAEMLKMYGSQFQDLASKIDQAGSYPIRTVMTVESTAGPESEEGDGGSDDSGDMGSMSGMMGKMGKMLGKDKSSKDESEEGGRTKSFYMLNDVLSIEQTGVSDSRYEIPEGYKKK